MPFNIASYKANGLPYGGYRPSNFDIVLSVPQSIGITNVSLTKFKLTAEASSIPSMPLGVIEQAYFGRKIKLAGNRDFEDWVVSVSVDEDFSTRSMLETWNNAINRLVSNVRDPSLTQEQYKTDCEVFQYGKDGTITRSYLMIGAWPRQISPIELNWDNENAIAKFNVTFAYDYWEPNVESSTYAAGGINSYGSTINVDGPQGPA